MLGPVIWSVTRLLLAEWACNTRGRVLKEFWGAHMSKVGTVQVVFDDRGNAGGHLSVWPCL